MEKDAALLLVSRGVIECGADLDKSAEEFGLERVKQLLVDSPPGNAQRLCTFILETTGKFGAAGPMCDDRTALALIRTA